MEISPSMPQPEIGARVGAVMFPIGYPLPGVKVPDFGRKSLDQVMVTVTEPHGGDGG